MKGSVLKFIHCRCSFFNNGRNTSCLRCDCKRPDEICLPSTSPIKTSTLEDILNKSTIEVSSNARHTIKTSANGSVPIKNPAVSQTVDKILSREPNRTSWESLANQRQELGHIPFNPLPADMFAKPKAKEIEVKSNSSDEEFPEMMPVRKGENRFVVSRKKDRSLTTPNYKRRIAMEQANSNNSDFVPFVPFPPDYFAKKRESKLSEMGHVSEKTEEASTMGIDINSSHEASDLSQQRMRSEYSNRQANSNSDFGHFVPFPPDYFAKKIESQLSETGQVNEKTEEITTRGINISSSHDAGHRTQQRKKPEYNNGCQTNLFSNSQKNPNSQSGIVGMNGSYPAQASSMGRSNDSSSYSYPKTSSSSNGSWNKSLEGSSIKESIPLDMSEEAKAERWFKRAAQIKDISELENIPDEDFPEIMPMRRGVNRFVVTKRKTPLERRLTSSEYRRNLPRIKSDPEKDNGLNLDRS
jgi:hypothetical protein